MITISLLELLKEYKYLDIEIKGHELAIKMLENDMYIDDDIRKKEIKELERDRSFTILKKELVDNYNFRDILTEKSIEFMKSYYFEKKKPKELAQIFNLTPYSVECKIKRMREKLKNVNLNVVI